MRMSWRSFTVLGALPIAAVALFCCTGDDPTAPNGSTPPTQNPEGGGNPQNPGAAGFEITKLEPFTLIQGASAEQTITITRTSFQGVINITVSDLPTGVSALPLSIPADATEAKITLVATPDAKQGESGIKVTASDTSGALKKDRALTVLVRGQPGTLDQTFGQGGRSIVNVNALVAGVVVQNDGKVIIGGTLQNDFLALRLDAQGKPDTTFGNTGQARTDFVIKGGLSTDFAYGVAISPDEAIVMSGYTITDQGSFYGVARILPNGSFDPGFNTIGFFATDFAPAIAPSPAWNGNLLAKAVAVEPGGNIIFAGMVLEQPAGANRMVMARVKKNGVLDSNTEFFGTFVHQRVGTDDQCNAVAIRDSKIVCAGSSDSAQGKRMVVWRVNSDGQNDTTFHAGDGINVVPSSTIENGEAFNVHPLANGRVLLTGVSTAANLVDKKAALALYTSTGALDGSFDGDGALLFDWGTPLRGENTVHSSLDAQDRVVVAAPFVAGSDPSIGFARVLPTGTFDESFGPGGKRTFKLDVGQKMQEVFVTHQANGRIVVAGTISEADGGLTRTVGVYRFWN